MRVGHWLVVIGGAVLLDRFLKLLVWSGWSWRPREPAGVWLTSNEGVAFSLPLPSALATGLIAAALMVLVALAVRRGRQSRTWLPFALLVSGGASNLLDRLRWDVVVDYLHLGPLPVFNLADLLVAAGLVLLGREALTARRAAR